MNTLSTAVSYEDHIRRLGADTDVTLVEYGDFQSGACIEAYHTIHEILAHYEKRVLFVFRHFPMTAINPLSERAACASEAAAREGKFWQMHDLLFEHERLDTQSLVDYARALHLNEDQFLEAIDRGFYKPHIEQDIESGIQSGVSEAPAFFVNGVRHEGDHSYHALTRALDRAMETAMARA